MSYPEVAGATGNNGVSWKVSHMDVVSRLLVIYHDENGARVTELPEVRIFINFFPSKACIPAQVRVTFVVWCKLVAHAPHGHNQPNNRGAAERRATWREGQIVHVHHRRGPQLAGVPIHK